ncbi:MAG TPA: universal stress protein [Actinospica sp.]|nr:universal stress protein [Actinospica sp.]
MTEKEQTGVHATDAVVVGVDPSENALRAAEWAAAEAVARNVPLLLVHALHIPDVSVLEPDEYALRARADGAILVDRVAAEVRARVPGVSTRTEVSYLSPAHALTEFSRHAGLVVTGTRGHGGFAGMLVGSVSRRLAAHAHCPLVVVRGGLPGEPLNEVVLGVEPGQDAAPIRFAFAAAARYGALLHAVRVWHPHAVYSSVAGGYCEDLDQTRADEIGTVEKLLEPIAADFPGVPVQISAGRGNTVPVLTEAARDTWLLVVGAHRHRGPLSVGAGYVVDGLIAHSPTPVAVVPID